MTHIAHKVILIVFILITTSCQDKTMPTEVIDVNTPTPVAQPVSGKATLIGRVVSQVTGKPITNIPVRLAEVYRQGNEGAFILDGAFSPTTLTDNAGHFVLSNIEPREYVIVIGDPQGEYHITPDSNGSARVWDIGDGEILDVGELLVNLN